MGLVGVVGGGGRMVGGVPAIEAYALGWLRVGVVASWGPGCRLGLVPLGGGGWWRLSWGW